jgi:hypothetical protein
MSKRNAKQCGHCGDMQFILIRSNGKMSCRICVAEFLSHDDGCAICRTTGSARRWYKNRGSLCVNCLVAAMTIDEEAASEKISPKQKQPAPITDHGILHVGSDAWIEQNEHYQRLVQAWSKAIGRNA